MIKAYKVSLCFFVTLVVGACGHKASAPDNPGGSPVILASCGPSKPCSTGVCDYLTHATDGNPGTCKNSCNPSLGVQNNSACGSSQVCNPITAACEQSCAGNSGCTNTTQSNSAICSFAAGSSKGFCIITSNCPQYFKMSGGVCKLDVSLVGNVPSLTEDPITGTWEVGCTTSSDQCNTILGGLQPSSSAQSQMAYACSPITATCVQGCTTGAQATVGALLAQGSCIAGGLRNVCYVTGNPAQGTAGGTCEMGCPQVACSKNFQCAEGICQQKCSVNGDCAGAGNIATGKTTCDFIDNVCRVSCNTYGGGCTSVVGTACSPASATCVPSCTPGVQTSICSDMVRNSCFAEPVGGTCELPVSASKCTGNYQSFTSLNICGFKCGESETSNCQVEQNLCNEGICWIKR